MPQIEGNCSRERGMRMFLSAAFGWIAATNLSGINAHLSFSQRIRAVQISCLQTSIRTMRRTVCATGLLPARVRRRRKDSAGSLRQDSNSTGVMKISMNGLCIGTETRPRLAVCIFVLRFTASDSDRIFLGTECCPSRVHCRRTNAAFFRSPYQTQYVGPCQSSGALSPTGTWAAWCLATFR